jgi:hypothetical protein
MNLHVREDDITCNKDWKHMFKCFQNLLRQLGGVVISGFQIEPDIIHNHFQSKNLTVDHINPLMNPKDQQDFKLAFDMLKAIWSLPRESSNNNPGFQQAHEALWILGKLLFHLIYLFLCVNLSLSEQLEHLSAAAHLTHTLYSQVERTLSPPNFSLTS